MGGTTCGSGVGVAGGVGVAVGNGICRGTGAPVVPVGTAVTTDPVGPA